MEFSHYVHRSSRRLLLLPTEVFGEIQAGTRILESLGESLDGILDLREASPSNSLDFIYGGVVRGLLLAGLALGLRYIVYLEVVLHY
jgi:hypothetical protein